MSNGLKKKRVCIIGCGPAGMSTLYHFGKLPDDEIPEIVCYEKQSTWGGMWNVTWRTGTDEYGEHVHACMYYDLWTNGAKETIEYADYTFDKHFGRPVPSYLPRAVLKDYMEGRFINGGKHDWRQCVQFSTVVRWIEYNEETDDFTVKVKNLKEDKHKQERFTHVVIATGLFGTAYMPTYPGLHDFKGRILHAKDVRHAREFKGQRVLIIGSRWSAQDLAIQFLKFGSKNIIISYRKDATGFTWPAGIEERPTVEKLTESSVHFVDGTTAEIDVVLFCTGYRLNHPFLPEDLRINPDISVYPDNLYKGMVWMKGGNMKLLYLGVLYATYFLHFVDVQAHWACRYIIGEEKTPAREEMVADVERFTEERDSLGEGWDFDKLDFATKYLLSLSKANGTKLVADKATEILNEEWKYKTGDIRTYRDKQYKSIYTGHLSAVPTVPWMKVFNDFSHCLPASSVKNNVGGKTEE